MSSTTKWLLFRKTYFSFSAWLFHWFSPNFFTLREKRQIISSSFPFHSCDELPSCFTSSSSCHSHTLRFAHSLFFITFLVLLQTPEGWGRAILELSATLRAWVSCGFTKQNSIAYFAGFSVLPAIGTAVYFKMLLMIMTRRLFLVAIANSVTTAVCMATLVVCSMCVALPALPLWYNGRWNSRYHKFLQHFAVGSSFGYPEGFCAVDEVNCLCVHP